MELEIDSKKELILNTALSLLSKNGFAKTTLDDIAGALGMKKSSLYYYYDNKEALINDVIKREQENYFKKLLEALTGKKTLLDRLISFETAKFEHMQRSVKLHVVNTNVILEFKCRMVDLLKDIKKKEMELISEVLDESLKKGEIIKCNTDEVAETILSVSESLRNVEFYYSAFIMNYEMKIEYSLKIMIWNLRLILNGLLIKK